MTPKEKAEEIIDKMTWSNSEYNTYPLDNEICKQHAIIAIDIFIGYMEDLNQDEYWQEVKREVSLL